VRSLDYYIVVNSNLSKENQTLKTINLRNESYIVQLQRDLSHLTQVNEDEIRSKKKWRNATLLIVGANVIFLTSYVLSR
jgi:hypothetical protein